MGGVDSYQGILAMTAGFILSALFIVGGALAAVFLPNLIHCAFGLAVSLLGVAAIYLNLGAEFVAFSQVLVYVGAVAILMVFAILLTQSQGRAESPRFGRHWLAGLAAAGVIFGILASSIGASRALRQTTPAALSTASSAAIGRQLMTNYILQLEAAGLLLTVALIGGVILALPGERRARRSNSAPVQRDTPAPS